MLASAFFALAQILNAFIDRYRSTYAVEPICKLLWLAPCGYWRHVAQQRDSSLLSARAQRDAVWIAEIQRLWHANMQVYGADKVWR